jgi:hypothetical protein
LPGDEGGYVGAGHAEAGEEGKDGVGITGGLEVIEPLGRLEGLGSGQAAGGDKVLLDGEGVGRNGGCSS